jgi:hypothetical protein
MKIITLDFETYYDRAYSLSKLTTEEYIRDEQFEVIGVSVQEDDSGLSTLVIEARSRYLYVTTLLTQADGEVTTR